MMEEFTLLDWLPDNQTLAWWLFGSSVLAFVGGLIAAPIVFVRMPADYFVREQPAAGDFSGRHPVFRWTLRIAKNLLGAVLLLAGIVMIFTPGQGLLGIVLGASLLDVPGKRQLQLRIIRQPKVLQAINKLRAKWNRPALVID